MYELEMRASGPMIVGPEDHARAHLGGGMDDHAAFDPVVLAVEQAALGNLVVEHDAVELEQVQRIAAIPPPRPDEAGLEGSAFAGQALGDRAQVELVVGDLVRCAGPGQHARPKQAHSGELEPALVAVQFGDSEQPLRRGAQLGLKRGRTVQEQQDVGRVGLDELDEGLQLLPDEAVGQMNHRGVIADERARCLQRADQVGPAVGEEGELARTSRRRPRCTCAPRAERRRLRRPRRR